MFILDGGWKNGDDKMRSRTKCGWKIANDNIRMMKYSGEMNLLFFYSIAIHIKHFYIRQIEKKNP